MTTEEFTARYMPQFSEQQKAAVRETEGPVLLLAVPGSGKTTVLVTRLGYMALCRGIDPAHILRGKVSDKLQDTAFINGENLFCLNNGRLQAIFFYLTMRCLCYFLICLTCQSRDNQSRRVDVADIILKNDCWAGTVLFGANACLQFYKIDVSALELPIRFQVRASILICKSPLLFCSGLCSIHGGN